MNRPRTLLSGTVLSGAATLTVLLAGCSGGSAGTRTTVPPASPSVVTQTVTTSAPPSTSAAASSFGSSSSPTGPILCTPTVSVMSAGPTTGAGGHFGFVVTVRNASAQPCRTAGYPGVALLDAGGRQIMQAERTPSGYIGGVTSGTAPAIVLQPGQLASALIEGVNPQAGPCGTSPALLFTLPDNTDSTRIAVTTQACPGLQVHPMVPGTTGDLR